MKNSVRFSILGSVPALTAVLMIGFGSAAFAKPRLQTGPDAEVTFDGLYRVDKSVMDAAWVKPDLDLSGYKKLMLASAGIQYKHVDSEGKHYWPGRSDETEFPISEEGKARFQQEVRDAFLKELSKLERYEIVAEPGPDVLMLVGGLIDVVSQVPPINECTGRCDVYLASVGEATLVIELRDSESNEVLARAADRRAAENAGWPVEANSVTVWPEVRRLAQTWASILRKRLEDFESVDELKR
ncbi:MAG TPA: DUF3313 family protein [Gammaproteobacteria bacterium]|nr:DUF3313 family protein [Gammaproteobacteria bacterium]